MTSLRVLSQALLLAAVLAPAARASAQPSAPLPAATDVEIAPVAVRPLRPVTLARLTLGSFVGELLGALAGGGIALTAALVSPCNGGEGWVSGFTCAAGFGYATILGVALGGAIGAPIGVAVQGERRRARGDGWLGLLGSSVGLAVGLGTFTALELAMDQPTLASGVGGALALVLELLLTPIFYDLARPSADGPRIEARGSSFVVLW